MSVNMENKYHIGSNPFRNFPVYTEEIAYQTILSSRRGFSRESSNLSNQSLSDKPRLTGVRTQLLQNVSLTVKEQQRCCDVTSEDNKRKPPTIMPQLERERTFTTVTSVTPRSIKFLRSNGSLKNHDHSGDDTLLHDEREHNEDWKESLLNRQDARDVLYRNTYSFADRKLRYRAAILPRIAQERPWTVGDPKNLKSRRSKVAKRRMDNSRRNPQQQVGNGFLNITSLSKTHEPMHPVDNLFELKRINARSDSVVKLQQSSIVRQPSDLGTNPDHTNYKRIERPLKYENVRYKPVSKTNRSSHIVRIPSAYAKRDYKSAEAYKEYLKTASQRGKRESSSAERRDSSLSQYGYENRVLQSVIDVNQPEDITSVPNIDTSKIPDNKSIVIEIKSSWKNESNDEPKIGLEPESGRHCPTNSPDHTTENANV